MPAFLDTKSSKMSLSQCIAISQKKVPIYDCALSLQLPISNDQLIWIQSLAPFSQFGKTMLMMPTQGNRQQNIETFTRDFHLEVSSSRWFVLRRPELALPSSRRLGRTRSSAASGGRAQRNSARPRILWLVSEALDRGAAPARRRPDRSRPVGEDWKPPARAESLSPPEVCAWPEPLPAVTRPPPQEGRSIRPTRSGHSELSGYPGSEQWLPVFEPSMMLKGDERMTRQNLQDRISPRNQIGQNMNLGLLRFQK
ncbi:uncharacterized protein LOC128566419 [Nycticebus coucang]|uniref:uncharacterized protein LOC128566419 n=1 Tax=Nycticebus coucang TaxID=9470 RepID=UPI00234D819F|nr:uncharacterized protein LOC128566419 [Nycticebus coucang]